MPRRGQTRITTQPSSSFFTGNTVAATGHCDDTDVFESIDFSTKLTIRDDRVEATVFESHRHFTEPGVVGDPTTNHTLACAMVATGAGSAISAATALGDVVAGPSGVKGGSLVDSGTRLGRSDPGGAACVFDLDGN